MSNTRLSPQEHQSSHHQIALYIRLSREDGDKAESLSVTNQRMLLQEYAKKLEGYSDVRFYIDDGYTGTHFDRPAFRSLCLDIEAGVISVVIVKDLSRLGRNMPKVTELVQDYFPAHKVRFIAIDDGIDKHFFDLDTSEDMMIDIKNMFNGFYPKDISKKVRSTFRSKQRAGQFIGAFACYGYKKSETDHNQLVIDEPAAAVVQKIFALYIAGKGQNTIAKMLNAEGIPCPSEYKKQCGLNYKNCKRLENTTYWTYSSVRNILRNRIYTGSMVQNKAFRQICKHKAIPLPEDKWIVVPNTHEAIIDPATFDKVQTLLTRGTRQVSLQQNIHMFAGFLKCGNCGRAMVKVNRRGTVTFVCGSYHRYGANHCSAHDIEQKTLEEIIRKDCNAILASTDDLHKIAAEELQRQDTADTCRKSNTTPLEHEICKLSHKKECAYDDYLENLITKDEYIRYKENYDRRIASLENQIKTLSLSAKMEKPAGNQWLKRLLETGRIDELDRETVVEMIHMIYIYDDHRIQIVYNFAND